MSTSTLQEAWDLLDILNQEAYNTAYHSWLKADDAENAEDYELAEELREAASEEQAEYFRDELNRSSDEDKQCIYYWLEHDRDFKEQFDTYYGEA